MTQPRLILFFTAALFFTLSVTTTNNFHAPLTPFCSPAHAKKPKDKKTSKKLKVTKTVATTSEKVSFDLGAPRTDPSREWTIMVYVDGDNDLEPYALSDINEMEAGLSGKVSCVVLVDRSKGYDQSDGDWHDSRIYRIKPDKDKKRIAADILAQPGELNLGNPSTLEGFLEAAIKTFPAKHYALVLWDHGGGWAAHANDFDAPDSHAGQDYLTLPELSGAIRSALGKTGVKRLDLIGFDMCLMAQIETAAELEGLADIMVASQAIEPGDGWPYEYILPAFGQGSKGTRRIAAHIVDQYAAFYKKRDAAVFTLSALDLGETGKTMAALDKVITKVHGTIDKTWPTVSRTLFFSEAYAARTEVQRGEHALASIDLMDAIKRLRVNMKDFPAQREYDDLVDAMDRLVLASHTSPAHRLSNGVAIYAPVTAGRFNKVYGETRFSKQSKWIELLDRMHGLQARDQTRPVIRDFKLVNYGNNQIVPIQAARPLSTHGVLYTVEGKNILWISGLVGERTKDSKDFVVYTRSTVLDLNWTKRSKETAADMVDLLIPEYQDGANQRIIVYSGYRYAVSNGKKAFYATVEMPLQKDYMSIPILYSHPSVGDVGGTVYFNNRWWDSIAVVLEMPQKDGTVVYRQIKPSPDAEITTLFERITPNGEVGFLKGGTMKWGQGLELLLSLYEPGTYEIALTAEAINGRSDTAFYRFPVEEHPDLKAVLEKGSKFEEKDLLGTWTYIDPNQHRDAGRVVPLDLQISFSRHPKNEALLISEITAPRRPNVKSKSVVFLDTRMLPHLRMFELGETGKPKDPLKSDYSVYLTGLFRSQQGAPTMLLQNVLNLGIYMAVKQDAGQAGTAQSAAPQQPQTQQQTPSPPPAPQGLDGTWQSADGETIIIQGNQFQVSEGGEVIDAGVFQTSGNVMATQSAYTGVVTQFLFQQQGNVLLLQDGFGQVYRYERR